MALSHVNETKRLIVATLAAAGRYPGALVLDSDGLEWSRGALGPAARIHAASISKMVTAAIVLQLVEEGRLALADTVGKRLDAGACSALTVEDLLSHRSGILRDPGNAWNDDRWPDREELLAYLRKTEPTGRSPKYSNLGFALLGLLIEKVTGRDYAEEARRRVFEPLRLSTAGFDDPRALPGYGRDLGSGRPLLDVHESGALAPATGLTISPRDLVRFIGGYERVVPEALRAAQREDRWTDEKDDSYGLGLVLWTIDEERWFGHTGGWSGAQSVLMRSERTDRTILVVFDAIDATGLLAAKSLARCSGDRVLDRAPAVYTNRWGTTIHGTDGERALLIDAEWPSVEYARNVEGGRIGKDFVYNERGESVSFDGDTLLVGGNRLERDPRF